MAFKATLATLVSGIEPEVIKRLATLKHLSTLTAPITELVMRTDLELNQFQTFTDAGWLAFLTDLAATPLDEPTLTAAEASLVNTIRAVVNPDPSRDCCGIVAPTGGNTSLVAIHRIGSVTTWEHSMDLYLDTDSDCNVKSVLITLVPVAPAPALTSANPFKATFRKCTGTNRIFSFLWTTYGADPTAGVYAPSLDFKDADDITIYSFSPAWTLTMP